MLNKAHILFFILISSVGQAQMIEAESRPYRFEIDKSLEYEDISPPTSFDIIRPKIRIRSMIKSELDDWFGKEGYKYGDSEKFDKIVQKKVSEIQPRIIQEVGMKMFTHSIPDWYFVQGSLLFQIDINGFEPFQISIPLDEVESFKRNFDHLAFSHQQFLYNSSDQFVLTSLNIYNPDNGEKYIYENHSIKDITTPSFFISFNDLDH